MAECWTEDRLDDLKQEVEKQGRRMDDGFRDVRREIAGVRGEIGALRKDMDERFEHAGERLEARFDMIIYALLGFGGAMFAAMASLVAAVIISL